jgi:hypothetical protein
MINFATIVLYLHKTWKASKKKFENLYTPLNYAISILYTQ